MSYIERVGNMHVHTTASDGTGSHEDVAVAAGQAAIDLCLVTDHNAYLPEQAGWRSGVLILVGEEVHDPAQPDVNHLLVFGASRDLAPLAGDPQAVIDAARGEGALTFIAHPFERPGRVADKTAINWEAWHVRGYTGLEIWNYMSEFKGRLASMVQALGMAYLPQAAIRGPYAETLARWDALQASGPIYAVGGSDAHAQEYTLGPLHREVFGYRHLFGAVNTHLLVRADWTGALPEDARTVYEALEHGRAFVAYDALADARGFRFEAQAGDESWPLGSIVAARPGLVLRAEVPRPAHLRLLHDGVPAWEADGTSVEYVSPTAGSWRVEAYRRWYGRPRGWIFSNPITVRAG